MFEKIEEIIETGSLRIYFMKKRTIEHYKLYEPTFSDPILNWCKKNHLEFLKENNLEFVEYNPVAKKDGFISVEKISELKGFEKIQEKFTRPDSTNSLKVESIKFLVFRYIKDENEVIIFRRHPAMKRILNGLFALPDSGVYKKVNSKDYIAFDKIIDLMVYDTEAYIFTNSIVESIFFTKEIFQERTKAILENLNATNTIENFDTLKEDILNDANLYKRIAKLHNDFDRAKLFLSNQDNTLKTIEEFELEIEIKKENSEGKLVFVYDSDSKESRRIFANLILDAYYKTVIGNRSGENDWI